MPTIQYYLKEDNNQILVSGSSTRDSMNALLTSSKNESAIFDPNLTSKISSLGVNTSYVVQNGFLDDTIIPIDNNQELWVYRGYNTDGGTDGLTYRYNPHAHRAYKAYILTETGSGIPGFPYSPTGSALSQFTIGTNTLLPISADISGKYIESKQAILGNLQQTNVNGVTEQLSPLAVSSSFIIYDDSRDIHPFIWTSYDTLPFPPAAGASFNVYKQNITASFSRTFSTGVLPIGIATPQLRFNNASAASVSEVYIFTTQLIGTTFGPLISVIADGLTAGTIRVQVDPNFTDNYVDYTIQTVAANGTYFTLGVTGANLGPGFTGFSNGQALSLLLNNFPQRVSNLQQSQNYSFTSPQLNDTVTLGTGTYSYTSSLFTQTDANNAPASGSTMFGLYADYDHYAAYRFENDSPTGATDITIYYTGSLGSLDSRFLTLPSQFAAIVTCLVGTPSASEVGGTFTRFNNGEYTGNRFDATITNPSRPGTLPNDVFATRWNDTYLSFSSSLSSSLDGLYVFNQIPQNNVQVTASVLLAPWTGSDSGSKYGIDEYATAKYGEGETGDGPTWQTASLRIYTGSYPTGVPSTLDAFLTESIYESAFIHTQSAGVPFTMSFTIPSESISIKDCLSMALSVSSGSYNSASVENSLVVRNYSLEFFTPTQSGQGDGRVPALIENAFSGTLGFSNTPDCQPLLNNVSVERENKRIQIIEPTPTASGYGGSQPLNFFPILSGSAEKSTVPESNYTQLTSINNKYRGSRSTAAGVNTIDGLGGLNLVSRTDGTETGFGTLPVIDYQTAYFAYCDQVLDPYPVVNNVTQFNLKYLINDTGDALQPNLSPYTAFDVEGSWVEGEGARVGINQVSGSSQYDQLNGINSVKYVAKEPVAVLWSQTGADSYNGQDAEGVLPLAGAPGITSTFTSSFLSYGMVVQGRNFNTNNQNDKVIPEGNVMSEAATAGLFSFATSSRYGEISSTIINQASSSVVSSLSPAPNGGTVGGTAGYAGVGEMYFNEDFFAINNAAAGGYDYLSGNQLSDVYSFSTTLEFPTTMPSEYRTSAGSFWDSSNYNETNVGNIYVKLQYTNASGTSNSGWIDMPMTQVSRPILRGYFGNNQVIDIDLINTLGSQNAGLRNGSKSMYIQINPTAIKTAFTSEGVTATDAQYASFVFNLSSQSSTVIRANRRYRWAAYQYYNDETVDADRNYFNPNIRPQQYGSGNTPFAAYNGPYISTRVQSEQGVSSNVDGALNAPYWAFSQSSGVDVQDHIQLISPNGNANYGGDFYQQYIPYTASSNPQFPGGIEPVDTSIPAYNIPWTVKIGDEIKFQNSEIQSYDVISVTPPENTSDTRLVLKLDREVPASINKDFFILRRFRYSPNTVVLNSLFPYGGLKTDQIEVDKTLTTAKTTFSTGQNDDPTQPAAGDGAYFTQSMESTSSQVPSYVFIERPLSKKDNTPSGILFPEFPTALIELEPDKVITTLRDNKLIT